MKFNQNWLKLLFSGTARRRVAIVCWIMGDIIDMNAASIHFDTNAAFRTRHCELYALLSWPPPRPRRRRWLTFISEAILSKLPSYLCCLRSPSRSAYDSRLSPLQSPHNPLRTRWNSFFLRSASVVEQPAELSTASASHFLE